MPHPADPAITGPATDRWPRATWPSGRVARAILEARRLAWQGGLRVGEAIAHGLEVLGAGPVASPYAILDDLAWPCRPLRVGFLAPGGWADLVAAAPGVSSVEWFTVPAGESGGEACRTHWLDAVVSREGEGLRIDAFEHQGREAGWHDWSLDRPIAFAQVFPARVDCATTIADIPRDAVEAPLTRAVVEAVAVLSRVPARLEPSDRLRGRHASTGAASRSKQLQPYESCRDGVELAMQHLTEALLARPARAAASAFERSLARACGAWLASWDGEIPDARRLERLEAITRVTPEEPCTLLRLAAARFACFEDSRGLEAVLAADRALKTAPVMPGADPFAFVSAELGLGRITPLRMGRVAAGIGLMASTAPVERLAFCRDDLADELSHAPGLAGRDQDRALLLSVFRAVEKARPAARVGVSPRMVA